MIWPPIGNSACPVSMRGRRFILSRSAIRRVVGLLIIALGLAAVRLGAIRTVDRALAADAPGSLISVEAMPGAPEGSRAYRIIYTSTDLSGEPVPVSGVIIVP